MEMSFVFWPAGVVGLFSEKLGLIMALLLRLGVFGSCSFAIFYMLLDPITVDS